VDCQIGGMMKTRSPDRSQRLGVDAHRVAGVVHIIEVSGDADAILAAIQYEIEQCQARALVVDVNEATAISERDAARIIAALNDRRLDGHWQICLEGRPQEGDASELARIWHTDGREIVISRS